VHGIDFVHFQWRATVLELNGSISDELLIVMSFV
jgi:hypothetical protein